MSPKLLHFFSTSPRLRLMETTGFSENQLVVRDAISQICKDFPATYWQERDRTETDPKEFHATLASAGWLGIALPEALGGAGLGISEATMMMQTIAESGAGMAGAQAIHANVYATQPLVRFGTDEQVRETVPNIISGRWRVCFGVTEPNAGLDTLSLATTATSVDGGEAYSIRGQKVWITCAQVASRMMLLARTTPRDEVAKPSDGLSLFCIDMDRGRPGLDMRRIRKMGGRAVDANEVFFEDYRVPAASLVGQEGKGFKQILHGMNAERCLLAGEALGLGYAALGRASGYARDRVVFSRPIGQNQGVAHPLADAYMRLEAAKLATYHAARLYDDSRTDESVRQDAVGVAANSAKYLAAEAAFTACERAVLAHGGMGYAAEYDVERWFRECLVPRIAPVSREMILNYITIGPVFETRDRKNGASAIRFTRPSLGKEDPSEARLSDMQQPSSQVQRRGVTAMRYPRRSKRGERGLHPSQQQYDDKSPDVKTSPGPVATTAPSNLDSKSPGTLFFGESSFLTIVPGERHDSDGSSKAVDAAERPWSTMSTVSHLRLVFPVPDSLGSQDDGSGVSPATMRYLRDEGALTLPDTRACIPALQAYFAWFHPCFPVVDRADFSRRLSRGNVSRLLLQAMLFMGATYCDADTISAMGFADRSEAKALLYTRARVLFHADLEKDRITLVQSLFLMSFWRGGPSDVRDVRYWLGLVITLAESYGLHRSQKFMARNPRLSRIKRRIWWSIYVRERQAAASLGLPSRIRDEDCDVEPLSREDLVSDDDDLSSPFGSCQPQHTTYVIKMVEVARLLGRVIDVQFVPGQRPATLDEVHRLDSSLEEWKASLPHDMQYPNDDGGEASIWTCLLHSAYNYFRILIHRANFVRDDKDSRIVTSAACKILRIAEDMSSKGILRYGQMHLITSLFAALCIHTITIRRSTDMSRRMAEHRAQLCLLCLEEIRKYWRINNNVLDLFLRYLDSSIARNLHNGTDNVPTTKPPTSTSTANSPSGIAHGYV
ncbi:acyl-CoA dehydrogenase [Geosmithia morbida]|uniref:Acyl-CoA dehydrogenase n=1 Tax=Geosmithia morbida TaxID=1094350 RepID=A0A9P4YSY5_9HYPO|nr:acyl-CoA dehydrogenase [Geosmithia morbida]KAF4122205.1 acyl-CoA dehydrogenase [Geosmithia morbida]